MGGEDRCANHLDYSLSRRSDQTAESPRKRGRGAEHRHGWRSRPDDVYAVTSASRAHAPICLRHWGADQSELRRLRQLEDENNRLKRLVADLTLDKHMLSEALAKI
jgi:hypothetical protein